LKVGVLWREKQPLEGVMGGDNMWSFTHSQKMLASNFVKQNQSSEDSCCIYLLLVWHIHTVYFYCFRHWTKKGTGFFESNLIFAKYSSVWNNTTWILACVYTLRYSILLTSDMAKNKTW
jgi:hypothetical protein